MNYIDHHLIRYSAKLMKAGGVIAYPTEAVWGLGCVPDNASAVQAILDLKHRSADKGLILVASSIEQFDPYLTEVTLPQRKQLMDTWPGPNTWLVPVNSAVPKLISGRFDSVALRVSAHPLVSALCNLVGGPIVSTSANPQGKRPASTRWQVLRYFGADPSLNLVTCGSVGREARPSTIKDLRTGQIIRA